MESSSRISTVSEAVSSSGRRSEAFGPGLNSHNHARPETADASVMAKAHTIKGQSKTRPLSAINSTRSVEQELVELTVNASDGSQVPRALQTNNFFPKMKKKVNSLSASPIGRIATASSLNGSPRGPTSPVQSLLTLPNDPPSNSTLDHGISELASIHNGPLSNGNDRNAQDAEHQSEFKPLKAAKECCTKSFKKFCAGIVISLLVASTWVSATHFLKALYDGGINVDWQGIRPNSNYNSNKTVSIRSTTPPRKNGSTWSYKNNATVEASEDIFYAPFFTTWFCSMGLIFFLPIYLICLILSGARSSKIRTTFKEGIQGYRSKGFSFGKFFSRTCLFSMLWMLTNFLYIRGLVNLGCTEMISIFATNVSFVYLLSWVVLHEQFVGIRIVAVILSNTGIALLAYMDGVNDTRTLAGVVIAAASAAGSAIYKVFFRRIFGEVSFCQVAIFFTMIGLSSLILLWPIFLAFYLSGHETIPWSTLPWPSLIAALLLSLGANLLANFSVAWTYETFITLGLIIAVPLCAGVDTSWYNATFDGMKLAGIIIICCGFLVVLFPENWPDALHGIIRYSRRNKNELEGQRKGPPDLRTGHIGSRLRSPSGRVK